MISIARKFVHKIEQIGLGWKVGDATSRWSDAGAVVQHSETEFSVVTNWSSTALDVDKIDRIAVYKVFMFAYDTICWEICHVDGKNRQISTHINEEMAGYDCFCERLSELSGFDKGWFAKVCDPPFIENYTIVYRREPART